MAEQSGLVSVVIPAYNADRFIKDALRTIVEQDYRPIEIVVVNDGSTDATPTTVKWFAETNVEESLTVKLIDIGSNKGVANALHVGFSQASGKYISWLSADDMYIVRDKIGNQVRRMEEEHAMWSYYRDFSSGPSFDQAHVIKPLFPLSLPLLKGMFAKNDSFRWMFLLFRTPINGSSVMISRECIEKFGQFDPSRRNYASDGDLWLRYSALGASVAVIAFPSPVLYREHGGQASHRVEATTFDGNLTNLRVLKAMERRGLLPRMINGFFIWFPFVLRPDVYRYRPFVVESLFEYVLAHPENFNRTVRWYAKKCLRKLSSVKDPVRIDRDKLMAELAEYSQSETFKDFEEKLATRAQTR